MNHKKLRRLYREERLQVRRRGGRKRALGHAGADGDPAGAEPALEPRLPVGRVRRRPPLPHPGVVDDFTRECLALVADTSLPGLRVARELDALIAGAAGRRCSSPTTAPS